MRLRTLFLAGIVALSMAAYGVLAQAPGKGKGPFGPGGAPFGSGGRGGMGKRGPGPSAAFSGTTLPKDEGEKKILEAMQQINREQGRMLNVPPQDGRLLRLLCEAIDAKTVVEFGTSNGISSLWMSMALRKTGGKIITHEINSDTAALARKNFATAGVADLVTVVEGDAHQTAKRLKGPVDLVFIDADKEGYVDYLQKTLPLVRPGGLIVAHNVSPRMAEGGFAKAVTTDPNLETVFYQEGAGVSVSVKKR
jgi:predicted O-methyltransferase YrrM